MNPMPIVVPRVGGWSISIAFRDASGNPVDLSAAGLVPHVDFYQPNLGLTTACAISITNAASGQAVALVPADVVQSTLQPPSGLFGGLFGTPSSAPCRVEAYVVDGQGSALPPVVGYIQPLDWRTADPSAMPSPPSMVVPVGPAGAPGAQGQPGTPGVAGSADPQPVTLAGTVAQHQAVYLGPAGALVASCDQPGQCGTVLGLALAAGVLGNQVPASAAGVVTDGTWSWVPGPIYLGLDGALTQQLPATAAFTQQLAVALTPTSLRMAVRPPVLIEVPAAFVGATYRDMAGGVDVLRAVASGAGTPNVLIGTGPDGWLSGRVLAPGGLGSSRVVGGPHLASLPNGTFEDGFDAWSLHTSGTGEGYPDTTVSAVGRQSAYLHCPAPGDVAALTSAMVPVGAGVPVYVAARAQLRSGVALAVLSAIFFDRNGSATPGGPVQVGTPLALTASFGEFGGYVLPPPGARYGAAVISNTGAIGAVGAINVDEMMLHRQVGGPAAWQVRRAARPVLLSLGGTMGAWLAMLASPDDPNAQDGTAEAGAGAVPAPIGGILYNTLSLYLQVLGQQDPALTQQLVAIWAAATAILPGLTATPAPPPVVVSAKTSQVVSAVRPVLVQRGGTVSKFIGGFVGVGDGTNGAWEALYIDPAAPIGGVLYTQFLAYLTGPAPAGLGQPQAQSVADLAAAWAAAPAINS